VADRKAFLTYLDWRQHVDLLTDEDAGRLWKAIFDYQESGCLPEFSGSPQQGMLQMAFSFIRAQLDRDSAAYEKRCAENRENGKKGGRPPKAQEQ